MANAAGLAHQVWLRLCALAEQDPATFTAETRKEAAGWLWQGPGAGLLRLAASDVPENDRRRAKEYRQTIKMLVNVRGQSGGALPVWFIRKEWLEGPAGHVHVTAQQRHRAGRRVIRLRLHLAPSMRTWLMQSGTGENRRPGPDRQRAAAGRGRSPAR